MKHIWIANYHCTIPPSYHVSEGGALLEMVHYLGEDYYITEIDGDRTMYYNEDGASVSVSKKELSL